MMLILNPKVGTVQQNMMCILWSLIYIMLILLTKWGIFKILFRKFVRFIYLHLFFILHQSQLLIPIMRIVLVSIQKIIDCC